LRNRLPTHLQRQETNILSGDYINVFNVGIFLYNIRIS
jgi:hypothetical protein